MGTGEQNVKRSFHYRSDTLKVNSEQLDVDKGSLTAAANLEKLTLRELA